ncbi:hypothetical protein BGW38_000367 [Lunasporangiospora selenospora]|uniref:Rad21/Rec8-like protein N-terminal domain-containing protein n=1 Tax=Lunasporangiospora selenospora TaxID=979761 RepID=A0A9P6G455_9FUNG|nr:hypothetical protein BGW38_000367 [Lunasporangiospora selenospora]
MIRDITQPPEPFALRFSSNLMVGVVRVFNQQYSFYYAEVNNTWMRIKRDLAMFCSESIDISADRANSITVGCNVEVMRELVQRPRQNRDLETENMRNITREEIAVDFGWELPLTGKSPPSYLETLLPDISDKKRKRITLEDPPLMADLSTNYAGERLDFNLSDDAFITEDNGLYFDTEGNFVEDMPPEWFHIQQGVSGSSVGKRPRSVHEDPEQEIHRQRSVSPMLKGVGIAMDPTSGLQESYQDPMNDLDAVVPNKRPKNGGRSSRVVGPIIDEHLELSPDTYFDSKDRFWKYQTSIIKERSLRIDRILARTHINNLLSCPLSVSGYCPELAAFWSTATAATYGTSGSCVSRLGRQSSAIENSRLENEGFFSPSMFNEPGIFNMPEDIDPPDPEVFRRLITPEPTSLPSGMDAVLESARFDHRGDMPWNEITGSHINARSRSERSASGSEYQWTDFEPAFEQAAGEPLLPRLQKHLSTSSHTSGDSSRTRSLSRERANLSAASGRAGAFPINDVRTDGQIDIESESLGEQFLFHNMEPQIEGLDVAHSLFAIEPETVNFKIYVQSLLSNSPEGKIVFTDIIANHRRCEVAAAAFYHILSLSSFGIVRPIQEKPYGDIQLCLIRSQ